MTGKNTTMNLTERIKDTEIVKYLYLDLTIDELIDKMNSLQLTKKEDENLIPFFAKVRGYLAAEDQDGDTWLIKEIDHQEIQLHKIQEIAYYVDVLLKTIAAPTIVSFIDGKPYRATKIIKHAMQAGSYNYLEEPLKKMIANDLINRWLFFDEDRNPNNYLIYHDSDNTPFPIVIDYNKSDLETKDMKISGNPDKFGWFREGKTRFLTLLKPENYEQMCLEDFEERLECLADLNKEQILNICQNVFNEKTISNVEETSEVISDNIIFRSKYLNQYFRKWFTKRDVEKEKKIDDRYAGLGQSFVNYYKDNS